MEPEVEPTLTVALTGATGLVGSVVATTLAQLRVSRDDAVVTAFDPMPSAQQTTASAYQLRARDDSKPRSMQ